MKLTRWPTIAVNKAWENRPRRVERSDRRRLERVLDAYADYDEVFVHVGLSDVNAAFDGNPYELLVDALTDAFDSVLAPGFTDYFRESGVFDRQHSKPMHGTFSTLLLEEADYRTSDPCKSILVAGEYRFDGCTHRDTFAADGCFQRLYEDDVLVVAIGTPHWKCSYLHHLEAKYDAPYSVERTIEGVVHDDGEATEIEQRTNYYDSIFWTFNKLKLQRDLDAAGVLESYDLNGLGVYVTPIRELDRFVGREMAADPYYLVT
ncbi:AAC(3) family N-acetyltransferase [Halobaculum sp. CBA1158]|uniref:AAC(3) family N-acetyltransferase n=1 Tax=Halobaculum sp. CBA1158 TaxID=2904243 RepID=UPI001F181D0D|nr:AAC(3) family N-acetyltransferase [Halobaculum sp. CBA1158]UIP00014.1 AAC(3) family N-acetyltransferase [Halobaculum sp. CBA1158]